MNRLSKLSALSMIGILFFFAIGLYSRHWVQTHRAAADAAAGQAIFDQLGTMAAFDMLGLLGGLTANFQGQNNL